MKLTADGLRCVTRRLSEEELAKLAILRDGVITPATALVEPPERPIVWLSKNQFWERPVTKGMRTHPMGPSPQQTSQTQTASVPASFRFETG